MKIQPKNTPKETTIYKNKFRIEIYEENSKNRWIAYEGEKEIFNCEVLQTSSAKALKVAKRFINEYFAY